jgi:hypothetical protein
VLEADALLRTDLEHLDRPRLDRVTELLSRASADFGTRSEIIGSGLLGGVAMRLPWADTQVEALRALREAGGAAARLGLDLAPLVAQVLPEPGQPPASPTVTRIATVVGREKLAVPKAEADLSALTSAVGSVPGGRLVGPLDRARAKVQTEAARIRSTLSPVLSLVRALPAAVGPGKHTYLLLLDNPGEQRPGGGYIGAVGEITFVDNQVASTTFRASDFANSLVTSIPAPRPLDAYLFRGHPWELSDANWSPDFPAVAEEVARFYTLATGVKLDGVIDVDPVALSYVLRVLGPVRVDPYPQSVTADNALLELNYIINEARPGDPGKVFLAPFGRAVVDNVVHTPVHSIPALATALTQGVHEKHIALHFDDPRLQGLVKDSDAGGWLPPAAGDALFVADANLSGSKGDLFVTRRYDLTARVDVAGVVHDHLALTYTNPVQRNPADAVLVAGSGGAYRDYLRVYVPESAQLEGMTLTVDGVSSAVAPESIEHRSQGQGFAYLLIVPYGSSASLALDYSAPLLDGAQSSRRYNLQWGKQINALAWPVSVTVVTPDGARQHWRNELTTDLSWSAAVPVTNR